MLEAKICDWLKISDQLEGDNFARWSTTLKDTILIKSKFCRNSVFFLIDPKIKMTRVSLFDHVKGYVKGTTVILIFERLPNFVKMTVLSLLTPFLNILIKINVNLTFGGQPRSFKLTTNLGCLLVN